MHIAIVTIFPEMFTAITQFGVIGRAVKDERLSLDLYNPRSAAFGAWGARQRLEREVRRRVIAI